MYHGSKEVFSSDHQDEIDAGTIKRKCQILTLDAYQALPRPIKEDVYFSRAFYVVRISYFETFYSWYSLFFKGLMDWYSCCLSCRPQRKSLSLIAGQYIAHARCRYVDDEKKCFSFFLLFFLEVFFDSCYPKDYRSKYIIFPYYFMQYNPDLDMVQCSFCKEYFHIHCLQSAGHLPPGPPPDTFDCHQCKIGWKETGATAEWWCNITTSWEKIH